MIESIIAETLLNDIDIADYAGQNIYILSAPEETETPYIVISSRETADDQADIIANFDVDINIYEYNEDLRPMREIFRKIKDLLHYEIFPDADGFYDSVRVFFEDRTHVKEPESTLSRINMSFSVQATELLT